MVEGIAFYGMYKSKVLVIPCKTDDFCSFIGQTRRNLIGINYNYKKKFIHS